LHVDAHHAFVSDAFLGEFHINLHVSAVAPVDVP
jgi:hypothetical protein